MKPKALCYIRVSHKDMNIESQRAEIVNYCKQHNLEPIWYEEKHTGSTMDRPVFAELQVDLKHGISNTVVVTEVSRIGRTMLDAMEVLGDWLNNNINLRVTSMQISFEGAIGKTIAALLLGLAEIELETKKDRQRRGIALARQDPTKYKGRTEGSFTADTKKIIKYRKDGLAYSKIAKLLDINEMTVIRHFERYMAMHIEESLLAYAKQEKLSESFNLKYSMQKGLYGFCGETEISSSEIKPLLKAALRIHKSYNSDNETYMQALIAASGAWYEAYISETDVDEIDFRDLIAKAEGNVKLK